MALINVNDQYAQIKNSAINAVKSIFPIEGKSKHRIELENVWVEDTGGVDNYSEQAKIKARGGSWGANVYASLKLVDKATGKVINKESKVKLFLLPKLTPRASYIVKGNEYQVANQLRLRSGAYVKRTKDGSVKTQFNLAKGGSAELQIDNNGVINMKVGQGKIPLLPLLVGMGIGEATIRQAWGDQVLALNKDVNLTPQNAVKKLAQSFANSTATNAETAKDELKSYIQTRTSILPEMTKLTLGKGFDTFSPQLWLEASKKLINVERGDVEPDDVDNLAFKEFYGADDAIKERIEKNKNSLVYRIKRNLDSKEEIKKIINVGTFGDLVETFFTDDERSSTPEQINPLHMYSNHEKVTFLGPGSISDTKLATDEMRNVHATHLSYLDPVHTPESDKIGLNLALTLGAKKKGNELVTGFWDIKARKMVELRAIDTYDKHVAYPDEWDFKAKKFKDDSIRCQYRGKLVEVPPSRVDYVMPYPQNAFSLSTNLIPFMANDNGNRTMMAGKHMEQAIPLKDREVPLVQNKMPVGGDVSFEQGVGAAYSVFATEDGTKNGKPVNGTVKAVTKDHIVLKSGAKEFKIPLYNNFALNQKTFLNHDPAVKAGDKVQGGQLIADSNYTKDGTLALGRNLRVAYIPYKGYNFEDGVVITESAAKKLTSEHIHKKAVQLTGLTEMNLGKFLANFPNAIRPENREKLDPEGVIKKGSRVKLGDVLIAAMRKTEAPQGAELVKARFNKSLAKNYRSYAEEWGMDVEGTVVDVQKSGGQITVYIKTSEPARIGDKIAGRHGNKGIITKIIPDDHAPANKDGEPVEVLLNPHGVISRINIGQLYESAEGKVAEKLGKPVLVQNFTGENYLEKVKKDLDKNGVEDTEELIDPLSGKNLGKINVGKPYILKLNKQSEVNFSVRGESGPVTKTTLQPIKGGDEGSKALDMLTMYSLLSHGSRANLQEMATIKSENNPEYWEALKYGRHLPAPKSPFVFEKFVNMLKASGVDVKKDGSKLQLMPLTDEQVKKLSKLEIDDPKFTRASRDKLVIEKGGLLDEQKLGGISGDGWAHIKLKEPAPNPIFEEAIKSLTGLVQSDYDAIVSGKKTVTVGGETLTGGRAIKALLSQVNVEKELNQLKPQLDTAKGSNLDKIIKRYRYLKALKEANLKPEAAYVRELIPVIPPKFRPFSVMESGDISADDSNLLYRNVALINKQMKLPVVDMLGDEDLTDVREEFNNQVKGLTGLTDVKMAGRDKTGFIAQLKGKNQPKEGFYQSKVLRKNQNLVGRGTIIPEPNLHMDQVALPDKMAWKLYAPFVTKELIRSGLSGARAKEEIEKKTPLAYKALERAMDQRPVMLNRAPSLHKFSIMAFKPQLTEGKAIKIPPLVVGGFNADFDGDTMTVHVPVSDKAVREAHKMMPSRNLYKPGTGSLMVGPSQESQLGFYLMTKTPEDRERLNKILPDKFDIHAPMDKKAAKDYFMRLSKALSNDKFSELIDTIKKYGEEAAFEKGFTLSLKDLDVIQGRDDFVKRLQHSANKAMKDKKSMAAFSEALLGKNGLQKEMDEQIKKELMGKGNAFMEMVQSGARGNMDQLRQIVATPYVVQDADGQLIPTPIKKSFSEGLSLSDYWISSYGARRGMMDRALATQEPGVFNKSLMAATMNNVVSMEDCGTKDGIMMPIDSSEIFGRFVQGNQAGVGDETIINEDVLKRFKKAGMKQVFVRSPLKCKAPKGTCRHCYGIDENGRVVEIGDNLGAKSAQTIAEPVTQMTMKTFHTGGVAGAQGTQGFDRIRELLDMPKNMKVGKATLATMSGIVEKIEPSGLGGFNVFIGGKKHVTAPNLKLKVSKGSSVKRGDALSEGNISPQELLEYKDMREVQTYLTDELKGAYASQGMNIDRKTFETVVRSITDRAEVINDVPDLDYNPGDTIPLSVAEEYNKTRGNKQELRFKPYLTGVKYIPQKGNDWMAQMGATRIVDAIINGASQGWMSDTKDYHPIPAFAVGARFGDGDDGKY